MQANIVREPKGGPDIVLIGAPSAEKLLLKSGDFLSVRGFTARIVTLPPGITRLDQLPEAERAHVLADGKPYMNLARDSECGELLQSEASVIAAEAFRRIQA